VAAREVTYGAVDWGNAFLHLGLLLAFRAATTAFARWAFRFYRSNL
jgi:hypothetical protein